MNPGDFPASREPCDWFYQRSGGTILHSPFKLHSGWFEAARQGDYTAPNHGCPPPAACFPDAR